MIDGFLGTRADIIADTTFILFSFLPFALLVAFYFAKNHKYDLHKNLQIGFFIITLTLTVVMLIHIQFNTLGEVIKQSPFSDTLRLSVVSTIYLFLLVSSLLVWAWLISKSATRYPIHFRFNHKKWGKILFVTILFTTVQGYLLYWMIFVS